MKKLNDEFFGSIEEKNGKFKFTITLSTKDGSQSQFISEEFSSFDLAKGGLHSKMNECIQAARKSGFKTEKTEGYFKK